MTRIPVQSVSVPSQSTQPEVPPSVLVPDDQVQDQPETPGHALGGADFGKELDQDPDTSLVPSLYLHLLSEHPGDGYGALRLEDDEAVSLHARLHASDIIRGELDHAVEDWRFRPGRALEAAMQSAEAPATTP